MTKKLEAVEKEAQKIAELCDELRQKYDGDGIKVYLKDEDHFTIKVIKDENIVRAIRVGKRLQFDANYKVEK